MGVRIVAQRWARFTDAGRGICLFFASGVHPVVHACAALAVVAAGVYYGVSRMEWVALVVTITLVMVAEATNSALEELADAVTQEFEPRIGRAKDIAAGMVLLAALGAVVVGGVIFSPHLFG